MENTNRPEKLKSISYYIPRALKFYDLKNEHLIRTTFLMTLFVYFTAFYNYLITVLPNQGGNIAAEGEPFTSFFTPVILYLSSALYLTAAFEDIQGRKYTFIDCLRKVSTKAFGIILASLGYLFITYMGMVLLIAPGIILAIMYLFNISYIIDKGYGVSSSFVASKRITKGHRWQIFSIMLVFFLIVLLPVTILSVLAFLLGNYIIYIFVLAFSFSMISLMQQKLVVMMYLDLEYGKIDTLNQDSQTLE